MTELHDAGLFTESQDLEEQAFELAQMIATKGGDAREVRMALAGDHAKRNALIGRACDTPRREHAGAVAVEEQRDHEVGCIGPRAAGVFALRCGVERAEVELGDEVLG